jgi:hypothetical protein
MASQTNNEIRLRVDGKMPLSLQLSGDIEGRTVQLVPAKDNMTDLFISGSGPSSKNNEKVYRTQRGSRPSSASGNNVYCSERGSVVVNNSGKRLLTTGLAGRESDVVISTGDERGKDKPLATADTIYRIPAAGPLMHSKRVEALKSLNRDFGDEIGTRWT